LAPRGGEMMIELSLFAKFAENLAEGGAVIGIDRLLSGLLLRFGETFCAHPVLDVVLVETTLAFSIFTTVARTVVV